MEIEQASLSTIMSLYQDISNLQSVSALANVVSAGDSLELLQIKSEDVVVENGTIVSKIDGVSKQDPNSILHIRISNRTINYLKNVKSPELLAKGDQGELEDMNKLSLALIWCKTYVESKDAYICLPLVSLEIKNKKQMYDIASHTGYYDLQINFDDKVIVHRDIINYFFNIQLEESGEKINEFVTATISGLVPVNQRGDLKMIMNSMYNIFKSNQKPGVEILYPEIRETKSSVFMFFPYKENFKQKREFSLMEKEDNPLINSYLNFFTEKNVSEPMDDSLFFGSFTKDFPLGYGQATVAQLYAKGKGIVAVNGGPGTGKSNLCFSLIAQSVTNRAIANVFKGEDKHNICLITSTSNKAVENICDSLRKGFKNGFVFVAGKHSNVETSAKEVMDYINIIQQQEFDKLKFESHKDNIQQIVLTMSEKQKMYLSIKEDISKFDGKIKNFHDMCNLYNHYVNMDISEEEGVVERINKNLSKLNLLISSQISINEIFNLKKSGLIESFEIVDERLRKSNVFGKLKNGKKLLDGLKLEIKNTKDFESVYGIVRAICDSESNYINALTIIQRKSFAIKTKKYLDYFNANQNELDAMLKAKSFGDFFRLNLFKLNYSLYLESLNFFRQKVLKEKSMVIKALGYLISDNPYEYLVNQFGTKPESQLEFLRLLSLAYPVFSSTLASMGNIFPGINLKKIKPVETLIADEAGMITCPDLLPALRRSLRAVVIGDPKQLSPIVSIENIFLETIAHKYEPSFWEAYSPSCVSAFHRAAGTFKGGYLDTGRAVILDEHRRCAPEIAKLFIEIAKYSGIKVCSSSKHSPAFNNIKHHLMFFNVKNNDIRTTRKVNDNEVGMIDRLLCRLEAAGYDLSKDVGVITPYKEQEAVLIHKFGVKLGHSTEMAKIGTVHKFQGVEFKVILFSTVVSRDSDSLSFINVDPSLINVAISRAQESFIVVGDYMKLTETDSQTNFAGQMARIIKERGFYTDDIASTTTLEKAQARAELNEGFYFSYKDENEDPFLIDPFEPFKEFSELEIPKEFLFSSTDISKIDEDRFGIDEDFCYRSSNVA